MGSVLAGFLLFAGNAAAANPPVNLGTDSNFSVLAGSTVTNTGPTTMSADLGLDPGASVTGAPVTLGSTHIDDAVAIQAQTDLVTAFNDAAGRSSTPLASADLSGQAFTPGVYSAPSSLMFAAGSVTLNAEGDPDAVFIFQVGNSVTTGSATSVILTNGAQACNVFWEVGASVTLGANSTFAGTVMALTTITAGNGVTLDGRLLARNGAVNLDSDAITTSACSADPPGATTTTTTTSGTTTTTVGGSTTAGTKGSATGGKGSATGGKGSATGGKGSATGGTSSGAATSSTAAANKLAAKRRRERLAAQRKARLARLRRLKLERLRWERLHDHSPAHPLKGQGGFTG